MRLTLVTETYAPQVNGVSRTLGQLVRYLREQGDEVQLIHPDYNAGPAGDGVRLVRSVSVPFYKELLLPLPPFPGAFRALDEFAPDLVHIATEATLGLAALFHVRRRGIPSVSSFHTNFDQYTHHYGLGFAKGWIWRYLREFHNRTLRTFVPSRTTIAALEARGFERVVLWPRGVDSQLFRPDRRGRDRVRDALGFGPDEVVIAYVSRIAPEKNIGYLTDAMGLVGEARGRARFLFVGDGPARSQVEARMGLRARFVGYRSGEDLADHYAAADLFAFSSLTETFGNVVLEAMASGLPAVALRAGGVADTVRDGETGLLINPDRPPAEFAAALVALLDDRERRATMAGEARAYALTQSWGRIMGGLREHYEEALANDPTSRSRGAVPSPLQPPINASKRP